MSDQQDLGLPLFGLISISISVMEVSSAFFYINLIFAALYL